MRERCASNIYLKTIFRGLTSRYVLLDVQTHSLNNEKTMQYCKGSKREETLLVNPQDLNLEPHKSQTIAIPTAP